MKPKIKMGIDFLMTVLLLSLMAYQITGQRLHEWFGSGMLVLFIMHNILNSRWYGSLFKGKYTPLRIMQTIINFGLLISMLCLGFSGIIMSRHVFAALPINGPMATARTMHMAASYWGFVLMGIHIGFHLAVVFRLQKKSIYSALMEQADLQEVFRILPPPCRRELSFQIMFFMCIRMIQPLQKKICKAGWMNCNKKQRMARFTRTEVSGCGHCNNRCPFHVDQVARMKMISDYFGY